MLPRLLPLLDHWLTHAERDWIQLDARTGCYGTGYDSWGVQTNQKYIAAAAIAGVVGAETGLIAAERAAHWLARARAALRFCCESHHTGSRELLDGKRWGRTWISQLGLERMMGGVLAMEDRLEAEELAALRRVLCDEARYCAEDYARGPHPGIRASRWNHEGGNNPESNLWAGALLWRCAQRYADDPRAAAWAERGIDFLANAVSVPADATDDRPLDGTPLRERHVGANFFPGFALDHHGYLNVGYMVICTSNAAFLHFDLAHAGQARPEALDLHQRELWQLIRRCTFADGRLARIGGDSRLRYSYCQEYLLPALAYAADHLGDGGAGELASAQLELIEQEAAAANDGSFYGARFGLLRSASPYYLTRLESDRADCLALLAWYLQRWPDLFAAGPEPVASDGGWVEDEHAAALHRSPRRFASFAWRANGYAQGLCLPPERGNLAEWSRNLAGGARCTGDAGRFGGQDPHRRLEHAEVRPFDGGFATWGVLREGCRVVQAEGWTAPEDGQAEHRLAWVALPDDATVVGLQRIDTLLPRVYIARVAGLDLTLPNDVFNHGVRRLDSATGPRELRAGEAQEDVELGPWACVDGLLGVAVPDGSLTLDRQRERQGGPHPSIHVERIAADLRRDLATDGCVLDTCWAARSRADATETAAMQASMSSGAEGDLRWLELDGADGRRYRVIANLGATAAKLTVEADARDLIADVAVVAGAQIDLDPGAACVLAVTRDAAAV